MSWEAAMEKQAIDAWGLDTELLGYSSMSNVRHVERVGLLFVPFPFIFRPAAVPTAEAPTAEAQDQQSGSEPEYDFEEMFTSRHSVSVSNHGIIYGIGASG